MCALISGLEAGEHTINYSENANFDLSPSNSPGSRFPVDFAPYTRSQTESRQRWQVLATIREDWDPNALEPMPVSGISPLLEFTERRDGSFYCTVPAGTGICNYRNAKKSRMLSHIRKDHLNFRPFPCGGQCGAQGCPQRFPGAAALREHIVPRKVECSSCGKVLYAQNLNGHQAKCRSARNPSFVETDAYR